MLTLRVKRGGAPLVTLLCDEGGRIRFPEDLHELDWIHFEIAGLPTPHAVCLQAGDFISDSADRLWLDGSGYVARWPVTQYFERYAGQGLFRVVQVESPHNVVCELEVVVRPSKMTGQQLDALFADLQGLEAGLIFDIYAKTEVALGGGQPVRTLPPDIFLKKAQRAFAALESIAAEIQRRPYHSTREEWEIRAYQGQILRPREIDALCSNPNSVSRGSVHDPEGIPTGTGCLQIDFVPTLKLAPDMDVYEHRAIRAFVEMLERSLDHLARSARAEYTERNSAKARGNSWWETDDQPRLQPLVEREQLARALVNRCGKLTRNHSVMSHAGRFRPPLRVTPAFSRLSAYRKAYNAMAPLWNEMGGAEVRFAAPGDLFRVQDLSKLFEYWGTLKVLDVLLRNFPLAGSDVQSFVDTHRYVTTLRSGAEAWFRSTDGRLLRLRYEPSYRNKADGAGAYGRRGSGAVLRPDLTVEIYKRRTDPVPQTIIVTDFKYRRSGQDPHPDDLDKIAHYMNEIADLTKPWPKPLPRHGWIIYPSDRSLPYSDFNIFDPQIPVGVVQTRGAIPVAPGAESAVLEQTLLRLLALEGILPPELPQS